MFGVVDVAPAGELVATLAVLATALTVALAGDGAVAAAGPADAARRQYKIDVTENILDALRVMLDAASVEQH